MSKVVVTGASGFIGRFLVRELLREGREVLALLRQPEAQGQTLRAWLEAQGVVSAGLSTQAYELSLPPPVVVGEVAAVYHCAAVFGFGLRRQALWPVNVGAALAWVDWLAARPERPQLVLVSGYMLPLTTLAELATRGLGVTAPEAAWERAAQAFGAYEISKAEAQLRVQARAGELGVALTVVHPATVVGDSATAEADRRSGFGQLVGDVAAGRFALMPGGAGYWLPLVSMDVVAGFMARLLRYPDSRGQEYLLLDPGSPQMPALLGQIARAAGRRAPRHSLSPALMQRFLRLPGLARSLGIYPESLHFVRPWQSVALEREQALLRQMGLAHGDMADLLARCLPGLLAKPA